MELNKTKRGYFVHSKDMAAGFAVVASTAKEARKLAYDVYPVDVKWTDLRCSWVHHAAIGGLSIGVIEDPREGLIRGFYDLLAEYPCDGCGEYADVVCYHGRALCPSCVEQVQRGQSDE